MSGFHRINIQLTERQYRVLMAESNAAGLRVGTICRMLLHDDIASGRATKFLRLREAERSDFFYAQKGDEPCE